MKNIKELELAFFIIILIILLDCMYFFNLINLNYFLYFMFGLLFLSIIAIVYTYIRLKKESVHNNMDLILNYESLTQLPNKNKFLKDLLEILKSKDKYCIVSLNIKNFKGFLDIYGVSESNRLLKFLANILKKSISEKEILSCFGDDNFALALEYIDDDILKSRLEEINTKVDEFNKNIKINLSFGIYVITDRRYSPTIILNKADLSRKSIAGQYDTPYAFYDESLKSENIRFAEIENYMDESLTNKDFLVYYQPKYNLSKRKVMGLEALVRWNHPKLGMIYPDMFISIFEKNNFILKLDLYVLEEACRNINRWEKNGNNIVPISVNLSRANLNNPNLISDIQSIVKKYHVNPKYIEFEFTESIIYNNIEVFLKIIETLHQIGYLVSIDDFGAGHSSLNILKKLPVDTLKIDKEFLNDDNTKGEIIIANTIILAKELNMKVLMEGVETKKQLSFLKKMHCDYAQGYYYNKPLPLKEIEKIIKTDK